jgi:phenylalanyl-tRNA synthetase alpha chain
MNKLNSKSKEYIISTDSEKNLKKSLLERKDVEAQRIIKYLEMPDLSRTESSPLFEIIQKVRNLPGLNGFDNIVIPEIVPADISFDLFDFAPNHPARSKSDTYYVDDKNILRTHDTVMWYYYMNLPEIKEKIKNGESLGVMCYGKVYRKDEIDRKHMNIFHQMGGLYMI